MSPNPKNKFSLELRDTFRQYKYAVKTAFWVIQDLSELGLNRKHFYFALFGGALSGLLEILQLGLLFHLIEALIVHSPDRILRGLPGFWMKPLIPVAIQNTQWIWVYLLAFAASAKWVEIYAGHKSQYFIKKTKTEVQTSLTSLLIKRSIEVGFSFFHTKNSQRRITLEDLPVLIGEQADRYSNQLIGAYTVLLGLINFMFYIVVCALVSPILLVILAVASPGTRWLANRSINAARMLARAKRQEKLQTQERYESLIRAFPLIKSVNQEPAEIANYKQILLEQIESKNEFSNLEVMQKPLRETRKMFSTGVVLLITPFLPHLNEPHKLPATFLGVLLLRQIETHLEKIDLGALLLNGFQSLKRILEPLLSPNIFDHYIQEGSMSARLSNQIELKNLSFSYDRTKLALKELSLTLPVGSVTAVVGATGSGKSTISKLLLRLYNAPRNSYFIDGIDVNDLSTVSVRNLFSLVPQTPIWMERTLASNLRYGCTRNIPDDELRAVTARLGILQKIESLSDGFETIMSQDGAPFSQGQQQCLAIARVILRDSPVVILDEPTSALDALTEARVLSYLEELKNGKTVIVVAHRLSTILGASQILVMEEGQIVEKGSPKELIQQRGRFYQLWQAQGQFWREYSREKLSPLQDIQNLDG